MRESIRFTIPLAPRTKKNSQRIVRYGNRRGIRPSKAFEEHQDKAGWYIPYKGAMLEERCCVRARYYMDTNRAVDLGNLLAATCDILVHYGVLMDDNARIVVHHDGSRVFVDRKQPRAEIEIIPLEDEI